MGVNRHIRLIVLILLVAVINTGCKKRKMGGMKAICRSRITNLVKLGLLYADDHKGQFPVAKGEKARAHDSLQFLVDYFEFFQDPELSELFVCPCSDQLPAEPDVDGNFRLSAQNVSYAWRTKPLNIADNPMDVIVACEKYLNHYYWDSDEGAVFVVYGNASWDLLSESDLGPGGLEDFLVKHDLTR